MKYAYFFTLLCSLVSCSVQEKFPYDLMISNVNLVDVVKGEVKNNVNIYIEDGKIAKIDEQEISTSENVIDGTGKYVIFHGYSLHEEMQLLELGGMKPMEILKMGTINAAKMMKSENELGSVDIGKKADLILLEENPLESIANTLKIQAIIKNGVIQKRIEK